MKKINSKSRKVRFVYYKLTGSDVMIIKPKKGNFISKSQIKEIRDQLIKKNGRSRLVFFKVAY
jgi:hypothetical protein